MDQRRWEDLDKDCLVKVFGKVGMESLLLDIPFVCKSWHKETLNPSCWNRLIFPDFEPEFPFEFDYPIYERFVSEFGLEKNRFSKTAFIKYVVNRGQGNVVFLKLPGCSSLEAFQYVTDACPNLVIFGLPRCLLWEEHINLELIGKFKNLFMLSLGSCTNLDRVLAVVSKYCKLFSNLTLSNALIREEEAMAIVKLVPDIKLLILNGAQIDRDSLIILLKGCKELVLLEAKDCIGFNEGDDEIKNLASHIPNFHCEGSKERFVFPIDTSEVLSFLTGDVLSEIASMFAEVDIEEGVDGEREVDIEESIER
ncbi:F-box protein FBW2-like [Argentina anserina]|uniref:F-box protein FBW2-like n=1 Tax=Argentina anserina TaxID=57926 RepID=UPI0021768D63|nr:F-box protein FBW2-like [Potentilla anserina]